MDPTTTLAQWLEDGSPEARKALRHWLHMGGFAPRVEAHPATDAWMSGDRYGNVIDVGTKYAYVRMDRSGKVRKFTRGLITTKWANFTDKE